MPEWANEAVPPPPSAPAPTAALAERLRAEDADDLVAICPLEEFAGTGEAVRVYRGTAVPAPIPETPPGPAFCLGDLGDSSVTATLGAAGAGRTWFAFGALESLLKRLTGAPVGPLGPVLFAAGRTGALARTWRLLARDLMQSGVLQDRLAVTPEQVTDLALRASALHDLADPGQWRQGRHRVDREASGRLALEALADLMNPAAPGGTAMDGALAEYWQGLGCWYSCRPPDSATTTPTALPTGDLARMRDTLSAYLTREVPAADDPHRRTAEALIAIGALVWSGGRDGAPRLPAEETGWTPEAVELYLAAVANDARPLDTPSPLFPACLADYARLRAEGEPLKARPDEAAIDGLLGRLECERDRMRLPAHEEAVMRHLYDTEIGALVSLRSALGPAAQIRVRVLNPYLDQGVESMVTVEVTNEGGVGASDFELDLILKEDAIPPRTERGYRRHSIGAGPLQPPIRFLLAPAGSKVMLQAVYRFRDGRGAQQEGRQNLPPLEVQPRTLQVRTRLDMPYVAGPPVSGSELFFGRRDELLSIFSILAGGTAQPILLRGPRRMGKTSLMRQVLWLLQHPDQLDGYPLGRGQKDALSAVCPVFFDLQDLISAGGGSADVQFFRGLLAGVHKALDTRVPLPWSDTDPDLVNAFVNGLGQLLDLTRRPVLIMVDEWDVAAALGSESLPGNLRSVINRERRVQWIIASTLIKRHEQRQSGSLLAQTCTIREIKEPDWDAARDIVLRPAQRVGLHWHGDAVVAAIAQTGSWPFLIQMLGAGAVNLLNTRGQAPEVRIETVNAVIGNMVSGAPELPLAAEHFSSIFTQAATVDERDTVRALGWMILRVLEQADPAALSWSELNEGVTRIAERLVPDRQGWEDWFAREFYDQIQLLHEVQYVIAPDAADLYRIRVPIFRAWFNRTAPARYPEMADRLSRDLRRALDD